MGHLAWLWVSASVFAASAAEAAQGPATAAFPPARPAPAAASGSASAPLPAAPAPPPGAPAAAPPPVAVPAAAPAPLPPPEPPPPAAPAPVAPPAAYPAAPYPGYAGYPPPGYPYYYPPPMPRVRERVAENAAVSSVPFIDLLVASVSWQNRLSEFLNVGLQAGTYVGGRVRLAANVLLPSNTLSDGYDVAYTPAQTNDFYSHQPSKPVSLFYGFSAGVVAVSTPTFVMSPGILFSRTDVSDYGSSLAMSLPFEWVTAGGLRLGLEFDAGRAFGGRYHLQCSGNGVPPGFPGSGCAGSSTLTQDRPAGTSIVLQFQLGFGFNHPDPLPPPAENAPPARWPAAPAPPPG